MTKDDQKHLSERKLLANIRDTIKGQFESVFQELSEFERKYDNFIEAPGNQDLKGKQLRLKELIKVLDQGRQNIENSISEITSILQAKGINTLE
jgi:hypothetical protein